MKLELDCAARRSLAPSGEPRVLGDNDAGLCVQLHEGAPIKLGHPILAQRVIPFDAAEHSRISRSELNSQSIGKVGAIEIANCGRLDYEGLKQRIVLGQGATEL